MSTSVEERIFVVGVSLFIASKILSLMWRPILNVGGQSHLCQQVGLTSSFFIGSGYGSTSNTSLG
ncbi:MAG TPA: hypothetical protein PL157_02480, partial [Acidobacteriota bacterium]|nr:hypothetical protein [Acidobacteriota bacterium]